MRCILKVTAAAGLAFAFLSAPALAEKAAAPGPIAKACKADAKKFCPKTKAMTEDDISACLEQHTAHVSKKCKKALGGGK